MLMVQERLIDVLPGMCLDPLIFPLLMAGESPLPALSTPEGYRSPASVYPNRFRFEPSESISPEPRTGDDDKDEEEDDEMDDDDQEEEEEETDPRTTKEYWLEEMGQKVRSSARNQTDSISSVEADDL
jgi:hypothetical protein